jgi:DNA-binding MarR family transcriptional regulator
MLDTLERNGYVKRHKDAADGRQVMIEISPSGRRAVRTRRAAIAEMYLKVAANLSPTEWLAIKNSLPALEHLAELTLQRDKSE